MEVYEAMRTTFAARQYTPDPGRGFRLGGDFRRRKA